MKFLQQGQNCQHPMAKLSVIFPVGKVTEFTVPSLESALNQTLSDFVIFAVDNTKEGYLRELLLPYQDERIVYLRYGDRFGAAAARNFA